VVGYVACASVSLGARGVLELVPAKAQSRRCEGPGLGSEGSVSLRGRRKRRSTKVRFGLVRTRVEVGSKGCGGRLSGLELGRPRVYGIGVPAGRG
jgi:hypothetical protein